MNRGLNVTGSVSSLSPRGTSGERAGERGNQTKTASSPRPSPPSFLRRRGSSRRFMVPRHAHPRKGAFHEPGVERDRVGLLPLPARNERGEGRGEGKSNKDGLLSPPARPKPRRCFGLRTRQAPLPLGRPKPLRRGEGPALSSFVPQEEREKSSVHGPKACAKAKEGSL